MSTIETANDVNHEKRVVQRKSRRKLLTVPIHQRKKTEGSVRWPNLCEIMNSQAHQRKTIDNKAPDHYRKSGSDGQRVTSKRTDEISPYGSGCRPRSQARKRERMYVRAGCESTERDGVDGVIVEGAIYANEVKCRGRRENSFSLQVCDAPAFASP